MEKTFSSLYLQFLHVTPVKSTKARPLGVLEASARPLSRVPTHGKSDLPPSGSMKESSQAKMAPLGR
ncbi:hypothetical protein D3C83_156010 [compost metagenome]